LVRVDFGYELTVYPVHELTYDQYPDPSSFHVDQYPDLSSSHVKDTFGHSQTTFLSVHELTYDQYPDPSSFHVDQYPDPSSSHVKDTFGHSQTPFFFVVLLLGSLQIMTYGVNVVSLSSWLSLRRVWLQVYNWHGSLLLSNIFLNNS